MPTSKQESLTKDILYSIVQGNLVIISQKLHNRYGFIVSKVTLPEVSYFFFRENQLKLFVLKFSQLPQKYLGPVQMYYETNAYSFFMLTHHAMLIPVNKNRLTVLY